MINLTILDMEIWDFIGNCNATLSHEGTRLAWWEGDQVIAGYDDREDHQFILNRLADRLHVPRKIAFSPIGIYTGPPKHGPSSPWAPYKEPFDDHIRAHREYLLSLINRRPGGNINTERYLQFPEAQVWIGRLPDRWAAVQVRWERIQRVARMHRAGLRYADMAKITRVSKDRVRQLIRIARYESDKSPAELYFEETQDVQRFAILIGAREQ